MAACRALPASWQTWSMWSTIVSSVTPVSSGVVSPRTQPGYQHPGVEGRADDGAAADQPLDLVVGELPLVGDQGPAVVMAGQDRAAVDVERLVEALVGQVRHVEDHADALHLLQQRPARRKQAAVRAGAVGVGADAVVGRADDAQAGLATIPRPAPATAPGRPLPCSG